MLPPEQRIPEVRGLVDGAHYFVLHAPRQVGKTTALLSLGRELTAEGKYSAVLVSMEVGAPFSDDPGAAELAILGDWLAAWTTDPASSEAHLELVVDPAVLVMSSAIIVLVHYRFLPL